MHEVFSTQETEETFGPSRLSPGEYLANADCRSAIIKELNGLLSPCKSGFSPLVVVSRMQKPYSGRSIVKSTLVVRWKGPTKAKDRLCIRGDMLPIRDQVSAPSPSRPAVKTVLVLAMSCNMQIDQIDISQAFLQADVVRERTNCRRMHRNAWSYPGKALCWAGFRKQKYFPRSRY